MMLAFLISIVNHELNTDVIQIKCRRNL